MTPQPQRRKTQWEKLQEEAAASPDPVLGRREFVSICGLTTCLGVASCSLFAGADAAQEKIEAFSQLRTVLEETAVDEEQARRLRVIADDLEDGLDVTVREVRDSIDRLGRLLAQYDAPRADLVAAIHNHSALRAGVRDRVLDTQDRLKEELNAEQWGRAVPILTRGMDAARRTLLRS